MNWSITRVDNYNELSPPEVTPRDRKLNRHELFRLVPTRELPCSSTAEQLEWRRQNTQQESSSNDTAILMRARYAAGEDKQTVEDAVSNTKTQHHCLLANMY